MRVFRISHRGSILPDKVLRRGLVHQFPPQREVWLRSAAYQSPVRLQQMGMGLPAAVHFPGEEARPQSELRSWGSAVVAKQISNVWVSVAVVHLAALSNDPLGNLIPTLTSTSTTWRGS